MSRIIGQAVFPDGETMQLSQVQHSPETSGEYEIQDIEKRAEHDKKLEELKGKK